MRIAMTLVALALAFGSSACKKKGGDAIGKMTEFKDQMCACKDKACADKVTADMNKWGSEQKGGEGDTKVSEDEAKKMAAVSQEMSTCMTKLLTENTGSGSAMAGSGSGSDMAGSGSGSGSAMAGSGSGADMGSGSAAAEQMAHHAGMCPSTVLGSTTTVAVKGKDVVVTVSSTDKDAIAAIQKRTTELLAEKKESKPGTTHDQKGTFGGAKGICPVHVPEGAKATSKKDAKGVVVTITPKDKPEDLKTDIDARITRAADWVKANIKEGDKGNMGGVGGGKGPDKSNHSGQGDGKGKERGSGSGGGSGGGKGTGGGGGKGTGGGGSGSAAKG